jgi:hypothetical protein
MHRERIMRDLDASAVDTPEKLAAFAQTLKNELAFNVLPMFEGVVDAIHEDIGQDIADLREDVDDILNDSGDSLTEETAAQIIGVFELGRVVCNLLEKATLHADAMTKKRAKDAIKAFRQGETSMRDVVTAITLPEELEGDPGDPDPDAANDEQAGDGDPEDDAGDGEDDEPTEGEPTEPGEPAAVEG